VIHDTFYMGGSVLVHRSGRGFWVSRRRVLMNGDFPMTWLNLSPFSSEWYSRHETGKSIPSCTRTEL
jgi:hypothetical protein